MTAETFFALFHQYGLILVCAVVFCEYMNLPGFPAGVIMPCIGVLIAQSELSLPLTVALSVVSGVLGSLVIYGLCYWGGEPIMEKLFGKSKKFRSLVQKCHNFIDAQHGRGLAIVREDPHDGDVIEYINRVNLRICPVFAFFGRKMSASIL